MQKITLEPIGYIRTAAQESDLKTRKKLVLSDIVVDKKFAAGLKGIEDYSHLFVIFWLHRVRKSSRRDLILHPRHKADLPLVGILSTRQSNHPNPIGLTVVRLLRRNSNTLSIKGLDAIDGTPVLDIKPYDPQDIRTKVVVPDWWTKLHKAKMVRRASIV